MSNSEYGRFSNVLARFEQDNIVGTTKSRDSIQVFFFFTGYTGNVVTVFTAVNYRGNAHRMKTAVLSYRLPYVTVIFS